MSVYGIIFIIETVIIAILLIMWLRCRNKLIDAEFDVIKYRIKYNEYMINMYNDIKNYLDTNASFDDVSNIHKITKNCLNTEAQIISEANLNVIKDMLHICNLQTRVYISKLFDNTFNVMRESGDEDGK